MQEIKYLDINLLKIHPQNPRSIDKRQLDILKESITKNLDYFETRPILCNKDFVVFAGNMRLLAARELGLKEVPVAVMDISEERQNELMIRDNRQNGIWEMETLANMFDTKELLDWGFEEKELLGSSFFGAGEKDDLIPENAPPVAKLGDIWQLGRHRVMCANSADKDAVGKLMGGLGDYYNKADMVFTDPPYGVYYEGKTKDKLKIQNDVTTDIFAKVLPNYIEFTKDGASFYVCCPPGNNFKDFFLPFEEVCHLSATIIWVKNSLVMGHGDYHYQHEPILYGWNKKGTHNFYGDRTNTTIWNVDRPTASKLHPTMKPVALCTKAILNSSKKDEIVLDLFLGSSSTLIACEKVGRICYGMELDSHYVDVGLQRFYEYSGIDPIRLSDGKKWSELKNHA